MASPGADMSSAERNPWEMFQRARRREQRRVVLTALPYPLAVSVLACCVAAMVAGPSPPELSRTLAGDAITALAAMIALATVLDRRRTRVAARMEWIAFWWSVVHATGCGRDLAAAIGTASAARRHDDIHRLADEVSRGHDPRRVARKTDCPARVVALLQRTRSTSALRTELPDHLRDLQHREIERIRASMATARGSGIAVAGAVVLWVVVRIVRPALLSQLEGLWM